MACDVNEDQETTGAQRVEESSRPETPRSWGATAVEWSKDLVFIVVLMMFVRVFVAELYRIPTGSMTPALVGDYVAEVDYDGDGRKDLLVCKDDPPLKGTVGRFQVFLRGDASWEYAGEKDLNIEYLKQLAHGRLSLHRRNDKILVNKFAYWFHPPRRGDMVVFKVPDLAFEENRPIYIKRAVGLPGETVTLRAGRGAPVGKGRLAIDGQVMDQPPIFQDLFYAWRIIPQPEERRPLENEYDGSFGMRYMKTVVPQGRFLALGDNTDHSSDGRYWGTIPLENLKGKAILRLLPLKDLGFLR